MVHELAGHRCPEEWPAELHTVPLAPADRPVALYREPVRTHRRAHGTVFTGKHDGAPAAAANEHGGGFANPIRDAMSGVGREGERPTAGSSLRDRRVSGIRGTLSSGHYRYSLKTPQAHGKATRVIVTEYDPPRPETLALRRAGRCAGHGSSTGDFGTHVLGMLDPKTGRVVEYLMLTKPGAPVGLLDLVFDKQGDIWMGTMYQGNLAKFDRTMTKFQTGPRPRSATGTKRALRWSCLQSPCGRSSGTGGDSEYQVDVKTGEWKAIDYSVGLPKDSLIARQLSPPASRLTRRTTSTG